MTHKPIIGMNMDYRAAKGDSPAYGYLGAGYFDCIEAVGGVPAVAPPMQDESSMGRFLECVDGFLLIGGQDLDPRRDGFMLHPSVRLLDGRRENHDRALCRLLAERRIPVFGIGVGMQLLNVTLGGNLFLHIPEDLPTAIPHKDPQDLGHRHGLDVTPGSLMERVYGDGEIRVNSRHHMAIDELAPGFEVTARCPDGVVEAIEYQGADWFALGTQFHPESDAASALDLRIFDEFLQGVREASAVPV